MAMTSYGLLSATWHQIRVSGKTCWIFVQLLQADGSIGQGEASLSGDEAAVIAAAERLSSSILQASTSEPGAWAGAIVPDSLAEAAVVSAVDQALWDLHALRHGRCVADMILAYLFALSDRYSVRFCQRRMRGISSIPSRYARPKTAAD